MRKEYFILISAILVLLTVRYALAADLIISTSQTMCGGYSGYDNVIINNSANITVCVYNGVGLNGTLQFNNIVNFTLDTGATINATGKGFLGGAVFADGTGPGGGKYSLTGAGGGGYGGAGGPGKYTSDSGLGGPSYNNSINLTLGSGGGGSAGIGGGNGGGFVFINVTGQTNISGTIQSLGTSSSTFQYGGGSGSGGGIYINTNILVGTGLINASGGGTGAESYSGGGGGGRIYVQSKTNQSSIKLDAMGGLKGASNTYAHGNGGAGSIYIDGDLYYNNKGRINNDYSLDKNINVSRIYIINNSKLNLTWSINSSHVIIDSTSYLISLTNTTLNMGNISISGNFTNNAILNATNVTVNSGANFSILNTTTVNSLTVNGNTLLSSNLSILTDLFISNILTLESGTKKYNITVGNMTLLTGNITGNLNLNSNSIYINGGQIQSNFSGYAAQTGPGAGQQSTPLCTAGQPCYGGGGGYGGRGANSSNGNGGLTYGASYDVTDMGSGSGWCSSAVACGMGGGYVRINVTTFSLNGVINANGHTPLFGSSLDYNSGGSGGGIWIIAQYLYGHGNITANGGSGNGSSGAGGGGGGGRIYIQYGTNVSATIGTNVTRGNGGANQTSGTVNFTQVMFASYPPTIDMITANYTNFTSTSYLNVTFNVSDDNTFLYNITLYLDGALNSVKNNPGITVSQNNTFNFTAFTSVVGNHTYYVQVCDADLQCVNSPEQLLKINSPPVIVASALNNITPNPAADSDDLTCNNGTVYDVDDNTVTLQYDWEKNSVYQGINNKVLGAGNTSNYENWRCKITPYDGYTPGTSITTAYRLIGGAAGTQSPTINWSNATTALTNLNSTSINPTNNNSWINFSVTFDDNPGENHSVHFCKTDEFSYPSIVCAAGSYCSVINSTEYPIISCRMNITDELASSFNYYVYVADNASGVSASRAGSFNVNHPPSIPLLDTVIYTKQSSYSISYVATDIDSDTINYTIYNSTNNINFNQLASQSSPFTWSSLIDGTYYLKAYSLDQHGYSLNTNSSSSQLIVDSVPPVVTRWYVSSMSLTTAQSNDFYIDVSDSYMWNCTYTFYKPDYEEFPFNITTATYDGSTIRLNKGMAQFGPGTLNWSDVYCSDYAGNTVHNVTNVNITITAAATPPGGGGGGTVVDKTNVTEALQNASICGNKVCQSNENPLSCPVDCPFNVDEVFCWLGDKECSAWVFNAGIWLLIIIVGWYMYKRQKGGK